MATKPSGHLFIVDGDLTRLGADAVLVPTDPGLVVEPHWFDLVGLTGERAQSVGTGRFDGRVMPFPTDVGPAVWLGDVGAVGADTGWYAEGAVEFVERASAAFGADVEVPRRVALPVVGSGAGGSAHDKGAIFESLVPALAEAARRCGVDVVLVTHGPKQYAAAQRVRLRSLGEDLERGWDLGEAAERLHGVALTLADAARRSRLVPFIGAGVSKGAGAVGWQELLDDLYRSAADSDDDLGEFQKLDVRDQATYVHRLYRARSDAATADAQYRAAIAEQLHLHRYALGHGLLASLGAREAVTTNYDTLYETAASTAGRSIAVLPYEPVTDADDARWLLKLHGSITDPAGIVLTRDDYLGLPGRSGALFGIVQAMLMTRHMLFVGYSLTDDSFYRVVHDVRTARSADQSGRMGTALLLRPDPFRATLWEDDLDLVAMADASVAPGVAARRLDVFLDLVGFLAADVSAFLLDPTYASMLDDEEAAVASALRAAAEAVAPTSPIGERVGRVATQLGGA